MLKDKAKRFRVPHVFTLLTGIIFLASLLSYVIPSGEYERKTVEIEGRERTVVVPGTYRQVPKEFSLRGTLLGGEAIEGKSRPVSVHGFLTAIPRGLEAAADIIFFIFIIGGAFGILTRTQSQSLSDLEGSSCPGSPEAGEGYRPVPPPSLP